MSKSGASMRRILRRIGAAPIRWASHAATGCRRDRLPPRAGWSTMASVTRILLLLPTRTYRTSDFLAAAGRLGVDVVVGAERRNALESLSEGGTLRVDLRDRARGVHAIEEYARHHPLAAVVGVDEGSTLVAAAASERLGLSHNPTAAVARSL